MESREMARKAAGILNDKKAQDATIIDVSEKSSFADYLVVASGNSERQVGALAEELEDRLAREGVLPRSIEGKKESGWILMDFGDVIANVFTGEQRERYNLEKVWGDCPFIELEEEKESLEV
ncbi:MAG: ribosome silencing factor [Bacillota bacterium]|nr:ribosome silencing factor [Bacillota bacterium]